MIIGCAVGPDRNRSLVLVEKELHKDIVRPFLPVENDLDIGRHRYNLVDGNVLVDIVNVGNPITENQLIFLY